MGPVCLRVFVLVGGHDYPLLHIEFSFYFISLKHAFITGKMTGVRRRGGGHLGRAVDLAKGRDWSALSVKNTAARELPRISSGRDASTSRPASNWRGRHVTVSSLPSV